MINKVNMCKYIYIYCKQLLLLYSLLYLIINKRIFQASTHFLKDILGNESKNPAKTKRADNN